MKRYVPTGTSTSGGIAHVDFWRDTNLDRQVAVKFIQASGEHRRLLDELNALQRIRSKHVVEVFDVVYVDPGARMGIVEEYIDGENIEARLGKVTPDGEFLRLAFQMASGLRDIHAEGVVHRDIKPSNMLLDKEGILKIIDFNLARPTKDARTQGFVGTRGYAAPEQYAFDDVEFSHKVDIYALAVTLYSLLTGPELPALLNSRPPKPDEWKAKGGGFAGLGLKLDTNLLKILDDSLSDDPSSRPDAADIASRLERVILYSKHRALFAMENGSTFELHSGQTQVSLQHPANFGKLIVGYDYLDFRVLSAAGEVYVNNIPLTQGSLLPQSCVLALGGPARRALERMFVTMDVSHPEVVL